MGKDSLKNYVKYKEPLPMSEFSKRAPSAHLYLNSPIETLLQLSLVIDLPSLYIQDSTSAPKANPSQPGSPTNEDITCSMKQQTINPLHGLVK